MDPARIFRVGRDSIYFSGGIAAGYFFNKHRNGRLIANISGPARAQNTNPSPGASFRHVVHNFWATAMAVNALMILGAAPGTLAASLDAWLRCRPLRLRGLSA